LKVSTVATPYSLSSEYLYFPFGILVKEALTDLGNLLTIISFLKGIETLIPRHFPIDKH
jgi:hypothetical protein